MRLTTAGLLMLVAWLMVSWPVAGAQPPKTLAVAEMNGVYRHAENEFRILALDRQRMTVQFEGVYVTAAKGQNMGYARGDATIDGNVATFLPPDTQGCRMSLTFSRNTLTVRQHGSDADCAFGHNVDATGTYRKIRGGRPTFTRGPE